MRIDSILLTAGLYVAFIPGVILKLGSGWTGIIIHAILFALVAHHVMKYYHRYVIFREGFGNFGPTCPNGWMMDANGVCRSAGQQTQLVNTGFRPSL